jgi:hypothetical protein
MSLEEANNAMPALQDTLFALERMNPLVSFRIIKDEEVREQARIATISDFCSTKPVDFGNRAYCQVWPLPGIHHEASRHQS